MRSSCGVRRRKIDSNRRSSFYAINQVGGLSRNSGTGNKYIFERSMYEKYGSSRNRTNY